MSVSRLTVPEMSCEACQTAVAAAVRPLPGVKAVKVDLATKLVTVDHDDASPTLEQLAAAIEQQGYEVAGGQAV